MPSLNPANYPNLWQSSPTASNSVGGGGGGLLATNKPAVVIAIDKITNESEWGFLNFKIDNAMQSINLDYFAQGKELKALEIFFKEFRDNTANPQPIDDICCWFAFLGNEQFMFMDSWTPDINMASSFIIPGQMYFIDDARLFGEIRGVLGTKNGNQNLPQYFQARFTINAYFGA